MNYLEYIPKFEIPSNPLTYYFPIEHVRAQEAKLKGMTVELLLELERKNQQSPGVVIEDKRDAYQNMRASVKNNPREAQRQKEGEAKAKENAAKAVNLLLAPTLASNYIGAATGAMDIGTGEAKNTVAGLLWNDSRLLLDIAIPGIIGLGAKGIQTAVRNTKWNKFLNDWEKRNYLNTRIENNFTTKGYNYTSVTESPYKEVYNSSTRSILRVPVSESELPNVELWRDNTLMGKFKGTKKETFDIGTEGVRGGAIIDVPVRDYVADISGNTVYLGTRKKIRGIPDLIHVESRRTNPTPILNGQFIPRANADGGQEAIWWNRNRPWIEPEISPNRRILKVNELDVTPVRNITRFDSPSFVLTEDPIPMNLVKGLDYNPIWGGYEKMIFQSPSTQRPLGKTSLAFFERPQSKMTEAERLGIPRGERGNLSPNLTDAIGDLSQYINSGQYRQIFRVNPEIGEFGWNLGKENPPFMRWFAKDKRTMRGPWARIGISTDSGKGVVSYNPEKNMAVYSSNSFKLPEGMSYAPGEANVIIDGSNESKIILTAPRTDALELIAELSSGNLEEQKLAESLKSQLKPTIDKNIVKDFWINTRKIQRPGSYLSGDNGVAPLGSSLIKAYKTKTLYKTPILERPIKEQFVRRDGLSPDSYSSIIRQGNRDGSLRWGEGFTLWNSSAVENEYISNALTKLKKGEITPELYENIFNTWSESIGGRPLQWITVSNKKIPVHPHPYIYQKKSGGKLNYLNYFK